MGFNIDDVIDALRIVKECQDAALQIDTGELKLSIVKGNVGEGAGSLINFSDAQSGQPAAGTAPPEPKAEQRKEAAAVPPVTAAASEEADAGLVPIKANVTSVFYRRPSPEEPPFVEVGDLVHEDTVVCLLEVMKCFRQVTADVRGRVEKICVESSDLVQAGAVLFLIRPE